MSSRARLSVVSTAKTFGGLPIPALIAAWGTDAPARFRTYFDSHVHGMKLQREYADAIVRLCTWMEDHRFALRTITPVLLSAFLQQQSLGDTPLASVRSDWRAMRVLFDWLFSVRIARINTASLVPDPVNGFLSDEEYQPDRPAAIEVTASLIA